MIAYTQAFRLQPICSNGDTYLKWKDELKEYLVNREYKEVEVQQQIDTATSVHVSRTEAKKMNEIKNIERVPQAVTYHPQLPYWGKIFPNHLPTLHISETMKEAIPNPPLVPNRRPKNFKDLLVRAMMKPLQQLYEGISPCGKPCFKSWMHIRTATLLKASGRDNSLKFMLLLFAKPKIPYI